MPEPVDIQNEKSALRTAALAKRDAMAPGERAAGAQMIAARALPMAVPSGATVSGFMPLKSEINPIPLMRKLAEGGAKLALPKIIRRGEPLQMRAYTIGDQLAAGQWGIREPTDAAPEVFPDILLVPLAVFDRAGNRIGFGAGYYDMTIARLRKMKHVVTLGLAFALQEVPRVPATPRDEPLDYVLTENETIRCSGA